MGTIKVFGGQGKKTHGRNLEFTVVVLPVYDLEAPPMVRQKKSRTRSSAKRIGVSKPTAYQVTVPVLPGLITFGRTLEEAREMAQDAIRCHLEGLRKSGEPIPDERSAQIEQVRVAVSA
jgi:predicted RNase H-like HicB family nuclease